MRTGWQKLMWRLGVVKPFGYERLIEPVVPMHLWPEPASWQCKVVREYNRSLRRKENALYWFWFKHLAVAALIGACWPLLMWAVGHGH